MRRLATLGFVIAAATLNAAPLTITTTSLPAATYGQQYAPVTLDTSGDPGPFQWSILSGSFSPGNPPPGFVVGSSTNTQGTFCYGSNIQGSLANCFGNVQTPPGSYTFTIQVFSNSTEQSAQQQFTLQVVQPLQFLSKSPLPTATANTFYSTQLQIIGGTIGRDGAQFAWSLINGALPAGIVLDPDTGLLSGPVSNAAAPSTFTVQVIDVLGNIGTTATFTIDVQGNIVITTVSVPNATLGQPYPPFQLEAVNAAGYIWSVLTSTPLPAPFSLSSSGLLTGSGSATGIFPFTVLLTNSQTVSAFAPAVSRSFILYITLGPLGIKETGLAPGATQNVPYTASLTAVGGLPPYAWSFAIPNPQGLSIDSKTGAISGTPPNAGTFTIPVILRDAAGGVVSVAFPFNVGLPLSITTTSLPNGALNVPYSATPVATGGATPCCRWDVTGTLPPGLNLNPANGQISGVPTTQGAFAFTLRATDSFGTTASKAFTINIATGTIQPLTITSSDFSGTVLTALSQTLAATGGAPPYTWSSGTLPPGLLLNSTTGVIAGTPSVAGTSQVAFTVTDVNGLTGTKTIAIGILLPPLPLTSISVGSTTQPQVGLSINSPYPLDITGVLTLTFTSSVGGTDDMVRFSNGTRTLAYTVSANTTQVTFSPANPAIVTGTVAGTITLNATMTIAGQDFAPPFTPTKTIVIPPAVPVISSVALQQVTGGLNVVVTGYSNTREVSGGSFTFTVSSGNKLTEATISVTLATAYAAWFGNTSSNATGGQFKLTVPFSVTQGSAIAVTKVSVTLTNGQGASAAVSSQ